MKNNSIIKIIHLVLLTITLGLSIISISNIINSSTLVVEGTIFTLGYLADVCALLAGFIYFAGLYKKDSSKFYRIFMIFLTISFILRLSTVDSSNLFLLYMNLASTAVVVVLGIGQNLGKKLTCVLGLGVIVIQLIIFFISIINVETISVVVLTRDISTILLSISLFFMILGKYEDKENRGTI